LNSSSALSFGGKPMSFGGKQECPNMRVCRLFRNGRKNFRRSRQQEMKRFNHLWLTRPPDKHERTRHPSNTAFSASLLDVSVPEVKVFRTSDMPAQ
jgi:hypothetical protein